MGWLTSKDKNGETISETAVDGEFLSFDDSNTEDMELKAAGLGISLSARPQELLGDEAEVASFILAADTSGDSNPNSVKNSRQDSLGKIAENFLLFFSYPERKLKKLCQPKTPNHQLRQKSSTAKKAAEPTPIVEGSQCAQDKPTSAAYKACRLVVNNILLTAVTTSLVAYLAILGFGFLDTGPQPDVKPKVTLVHAKPVTKPQPVPDTGKHLERIAIEKVLQDCTVPLETRAVFMDSLKTGGEFVDSSHAQALRSLQGFQAKYRAIGILEIMRSSETKRTKVVEVVSPAIEDLRGQLLAYIEMRKDYAAKLVELETRARTLRDGRKLHSRVVQGVNAGIRLRHEIERISEQVEGAAPLEDLVMLQSALNALKKIIEHDPYEVLASLSTQATGIDKLNLEATLEKVTEIVSLGINQTTSVLAGSNPSLIRYQVDAALDGARLLTSLLREYAIGPEQLLANIDNEQIIVNRNIGKLLGSQGNNWVDYAPCVAGISSLHSRHQGG